MAIDCSSCGRDRGPGFNATGRPGDPNRAEQRECKHEFDHKPHHHAVGGTPGHALGLPQAGQEEASRGPPVTDARPRRQ